MKRQASSKKDFIMGKNCLQEVLKRSPKRILEVYTCKKHPDEPIFDQLASHKIPVKTVSKEKLFQLVESESHQGLVAKVSSRLFTSLKDYLDGSSNAPSQIVLILDSIYDPQNFGTIIRCAECFGVDLVVFSKNRGCDITPVATKTSSGATELVSIAKVSNLADSVELLKKTTFGWGAQMSQKTPLRYMSSTFPKKLSLSWAQREKA